MFATWQKAGKYEKHMAEGVKHKTCGPSKDCNLESHWTALEREGGHNFGHLTVFL